MASGVRVSDEAKCCIDNIKIHHKKEDPQDRFKVLFFKIAEGEIIVDHLKCVQVKDTDDDDDERDAFNLLKERLKVNECCYIVYDCCYATKETEKSELVFIMWAPDGANIREKMSYASSKDSLRKILQACGLKHDWQVNDVEDIFDEELFMERLGTGIVKLERKDRKERKAKCKKGKCQKADNEQHD